MLKAAGVSYYTGAIDGIAGPQPRRASSEC
jgi:hypothetical protein